MYITMHRSVLQVACTGLVIALASACTLANGAFSCAANSVSLMAYCTWSNHSACNCRSLCKSREHIYRVLTRWYIYDRTESVGDSEVNVTLFGESLCPYCARFTVDIMAPLFDEGLDKSVINFKYIAYGNAFTDTDVSPSPPFPPTPIPHHHYPPLNPPCLLCRPFAQNVPVE